jgi:hypothetical protein
VTTPIYGLTLPPDSTALADIALMVRTNATSTENALKRGGIAPPAAQDLATLAGRVAAAENPPRAVLRQSTAQTGLGSGAWTTLTLQAEDIDSHNGHSTTTNLERWTCPAGFGGTYTVEGTAVFAALTAGTAINARVCKNGTALATGTGAGGAFGGGAGNTATTGSKLVTLVPGDYLTVQGFAGTAWSTAVFADAASSLTLWRIAL